MPDAKSLLPGRAFRSEHAQLRPEPHSIASHGPDPMDPLQTTRMRNGVLYAAEWPCCHDPLRLSLGSEDPFNTRTRVAPHRALPPGVRWLRRCARLPRVRGGAPHSHACSRVVGVAANKPTQPKHLASARGSFRPRPRRAACASRAWAVITVCADTPGRLAAEGQGGSRPLSLPAPCSTKGWRARAPNSAHTHSSMPHCYASPATNQLPMPEPRTPRDPPESTYSSPLRVPPFALGSLASTH